MKRNNKRRRIGSGILAVCLAAALLLSNQSFGVFAKEDGSQSEAREDVTSATEENGQDTEVSSEEELTENDETGSSEENTDRVDKNNLDADEYTGESSNIQDEDAAENTIILDMSAETVDISQLIDAEIALLQWKVTGKAGTVFLGDTTYTVIDDASYQRVYKMVYQSLVSNATSVQEIAAQDITTDTVWNVSQSIKMNGNVNVKAGARLIIVGNGVITRTGEYTLIDEGTICLQGSVYLNGNGYSGSLVQINDSGTGYITDDFRIGNSGSYGVRAISNSSLYMIGGLIGTENINFTWYDENNKLVGNKKYEETWNYIKQNLESNVYNYIKDIEATEGNKQSGVRIEGRAQFVMSGGVIAGNGGLTGSNMNGGGVTATSGRITITDGIIIGNCTVKRDANNANGGSGGGINAGGGGTTKISGGWIVGNHSYSYAGGINAGGNLILSDNAVVAYNGSDFNGGAVLIAQNYVCTVKDNASIVHNRAIGVERVENSGKGGAFRVVGTLDIQGGKINYNYGNGPYNSATVEQDVGGAISGQTDMYGGTTDNPAPRAARINLTGGEIAHNKANGRGGAIWLVCMAEGYDSTFSIDGTNIYDNEAKSVGGGIYFEARKGTLTADLNSGQVTGNKAKGNGGGMCFSLTAGTELTVNIGKMQGDNKNLNLTDNQTEQTGGGLCITRDAYNTTGILNVNLNSGTLKDNTGKNGGAVGIVRGNLNVYGGLFENNAATECGGGSYISDGKVRMFGGTITGNTASKDGGGIYVSSAENAADVVIRSGSITKNSSDGSGGGIAVASGESAKADTVILGLLEQHKDLKITDAGRSFIPFPYTDDKDSEKHTHTSCPVLSNNTATGEGGGIYMQSSAASLNIYCLEESGNISKKDANGNGVMMAGGKLVIGDEAHNDSAAWGNTVISSPMLVEGGNVDIWGSMNNPLFNDNILVDIKKGAGKFEDHRVQAADQVTRYKIHYFENFTAGGTQEATGMYIANQYKEKDTIDASGTLFAHEGWKIVGWATKADKDAGRITYQIGSNIGKDGDHQAWGNSASEPLVLYAIWERTTYTVIYHPNADSFAGEDTEKSQSFSYGEEQALWENGYKVVGKRFVCWNTKPDGTGIRYEKDYKESKMTATNGATIDLYAQWVDCTHNGGAHPGKLSYTVNAKDHSITETCDCENHTAIITLTGRDAYHDGKPHPAEMSGELLAANPDITYKFSKTKDGTYTDMKNGEKPTEIGFYQASITVEDKTVTVSYEIKSAGANVVVDAECIDGQRFGAFSGTKICNAAGDDAFTVWYSIQNLNRTYYSEAPQLVLSQQLPEGTTIIMYANGSYWYTNAPTGKDTIALDTFTKMGGTEKFSYSFAESQEYRFVFDFSKVTGTALSGTLNVKLVYKHNTASSDPVSGVVDISFGAKGAFALSGTAENLQITAPESVRFGRWENKNQVLVVSEADGTAFPADARLVVKVGDKTYTYRKNVRNVFVVPISWNPSQTVSMSLDSDLLASKGSDYKASIALCVGDNVKKLNSQPQAAEYATAAQCTVTLNVTNNVSPSLRIDGTQKVLKKTDKLNLTVTMENTSGYTIHATIQQKETKTKNETKAADEMKTSYGGNFLDADVQEGANSFSLGGIKEAGSYRLLITVTKDKQELLAVPYYFIVQ